MGAKVTAHPDTRIIEITDPPVNGFATLDVVIDVYSDLKEDWLVNPALQRMRSPLSSFGPFQGTAQIGPYVFLDNISGWRLQPFDADYNLQIVGNLVPLSAVQQFQLPKWIPRPGRTIRVEEQQSAQALTVETGVSGLTPEESQQLNEMWGRFGLDINAPVTFTPASIAYGLVNLTITGDGVTTSTVRRQ